VRSDTPGVTRTRIERRICADPTSVALLLAGPTAFDLWPGVRRVGAVNGSVIIEAATPTPSTAAVRLLRPKRTSTSYVTTFEWAGPSLPKTTGRLTLAYLPGRTTPSTGAVLTLESDGLDGSALSAVDLQNMAYTFLANLARVAEERSQAA
jgi:hypothetical protein